MGVLTTNQVGAILDFLRSDFGNMSNGVVQNCYRVKQLLGHYMEELYQTSNSKNVDAKGFQEIIDEASSIIQPILNNITVKNQEFEQSLANAKNMLSTVTDDLSSYMEDNLESEEDTDTEELASEEGTKELASEEISNQSIEP